MPKHHIKSGQDKKPSKKARIMTPPPAGSKDVSNRKQGISVKAKSKEKQVAKKSVDKGKGVDRSSAGDTRTTTSLPSSFMVVVGTYEKLLYGLQGMFTDPEGNPTSTPILKPVFIFPAHISCVKAVAASPGGGKWLASGSTDEIIKVWDLRRRKEVGGLMQHEGSITYLDFSSRSYLVSASEDGTICIFHARDWVLLQSMKGHKGHVNCVAVHPSKKVALSVGKDRTLRMWDFMRGKGSASMKLGKEGELVRWSLKGDRFVVQARDTLDIYSTDMKLLHTFKHPARIQDVHFTHKVGDEDAELLLVGAEDKKVTVYDLNHGDETSLPVVGELVGHQSRVKAIDILSIALPSSHGLESKLPYTTIICTISSDGFIRIFDLSALSETSDSKPVVLTSIAEYDTKGSRLTCCTLADGEVPSTVGANGKRKRGDESEEEEGDDREEMEEGEEGEEEGEFLGFRASDDD